MEGDYMLKEELSKLRSINSFIARDQMTHLGETVDENKDGIEAIRFKKIDDKVIGNTLLEVSKIGIGTSSSAYWWQNDLVWGQRS